MMVRVMGGGRSVSITVMKDHNLQISMSALFFSTSYMRKILFKIYLSIFAFAHSIPEDVQVVTSVGWRQSL